MKSLQCFFRREKIEKNETKVPAQNNVVSLRSLYTGKMT